MFAYTSSRRISYVPISGARTGYVFVLVWSGMRVWLVCVYGLLDWMGIVEKVEAADWVSGFCPAGVGSFGCLGWRWV